MDLTQGRNGPILQKKELSKLIQYEISNLSRPINIKETEFTILNIPKTKHPGPEDFTGEFYQIFKEELTQIQNYLFRKI